MAGPQSTGVNEALVTRMKSVLMDVKVDVDAVHVDKPGNGSLGGSETANTLESLMNRATDRINSALSETSDALIDFVDGLTNAVEAVKNADDEARVAFNTKVTAALETIDQPFFDNLAKDDRPSIPGFRIPFLPLTPEQLQEVVSRSEFGREEEQ